MKRSLIRLSVRAIALVLGLVVYSNAWAATPVAAWTDFRNLTSGDYTWTVGGDSSVDPNTGVLTIGTTGGVYMDISGIGSDNRSFSLAIEAEIPGTYSSDKTIVDMIVNGSHVSVAANGTTIGQCWTTGGMSYGSGTFTAGRQLLTFTFQGASGQGSHTYINGAQIAGSTGLMSSANKVTHIGIGSFNKTSEVAEGLKIYSVRLYNSKLSASDVSTDYSTYGVADYVTTVSSDTTLEGSDLTWTAKDGTSSTTAPTSYTKLDIRGSGKVTSSSAFNSKMNICSGVVFKPTSVGTSAMFTGSGSVVYNNAVPGSEKTCYTTSTTWTGTVWIENKTGITNFDPKTIGNAKSTVKLSGVAGYFINANNTFDGTLEVSSTDSSGTSVDYGLSVSDGYSANTYTINKLTGDGLISDALNNKTATSLIAFNDASEFIGSISLTKGRRIRIGTGTDPSSAKQIAVCSGSSVTVASGKTWQADGGIIVNGTLNVGAGSTIPAIVSDSTGVVQITSAGTATISGVKDNAISSSLVMMGGNIAVVDTEITELTIPAENYITFFAMNGNLDLAGCTSLTTLKLNLGSGTTFDLANVTLPASCTKTLVDVGSARDLTGYTISNLGTATLGFSVTETKEEYANGTFSVSSVPSGANVSVTRADGTTLNAIVTDGTARLSDYGTVRISSAATDIDWDFTDGTDDALEQAPSGVSKDADSTMTFYTDSTDSNKTGVYIKHHPYITGAASFMGNNSAAMTVAVVGTMPATTNTIFLNVGSAYVQQYGLVFVTTANANEVLIGYNYGGTVTPITTMTVPNSTTARHSYIVTKEDGDSTTTFTVYLDGIKWKTVTTASKIVFASSNSGVQVGSDFGGNIRKAGTYSAASDNVGVLNVLRVYGRIITEAEIAVYADTFPYVSPNGASSRTFATEAEDWVEATDTDWTNTDSSGDVTSDTAPTAGASVTVTASTATEITVNLASETSYEALTINGSAVTLASSGSGDIKVTGMTVIGAPVTVEYGAADFTGGPMTITEDGSITFDYSAYDISEIYTTTDIPLTSDVDEDSTKVFLTPPSASSYRTVSLVYKSSYYAMRVTPDHQAGSDVYYTGGYWGTTESTFAVTNSSGNATTVFPGDTVVIPAYLTGDNASTAYFGAALPENVSAIRVEKDYTFQSGVDDTAMLGGATVTVAEGCTLAFATTWHNLTLGAVTFDGPGSVSIPTLTSTASIAGAVSGTAALTISGTVNVASGGSIANAVAGTGTIAYAAIPAATPSSFTDWTGTVELPSFSASSGVNFNSYGTTGSTVALAGMNGGYILEAGKTVNPTLRLDGDMSITAMSSWEYTFAEITGTGDLSFSTSANSPTVAITKVAEEYSGTISSTLENTLTIGTLEREDGDKTAGTKLLDLGDDDSANITVATATVGGTRVPQTNKVVSEDRGIYIVGGTIFSVY